MNKKSFLEILGRSVTTFKNSFWGIILTYCFAFPLGFGAYMLATNLYKEPFQQLQTQRHTHLDAPLVILGILLIIFFTYGSVLLQTWQMLIIKNNIFKGFNDVGEAFKKALGKALQVFMLLIVLVPAFIFINFVAVNFFPPCMDFLPLLCLPFIPFSLIFNGIVLEDDKFSKLFANSLSICLTNYLRIFGFFILLTVLEAALMIGLALILFILNMFVPIFMLLALIGGFLIQISATPFFLCFSTELFLDLENNGEGSIKDLPSVEEESYPEIIDISDITSQMPPQQPTYRNEPPEGMQQLGGNYNDKK